MSQLLKPKVPQKASAPVPEKTKEAPVVATEDTIIIGPGGTPLVLSKVYEEMAQRKELAGRASNEVAANVLTVFINSETPLLRARDIREARGSVGESLGKRVPSVVRMLREGWVVRVRPPGKGYRYALTEKGKKLIDTVLGTSAGTGKAEESAPEP